MKKHNTKKYQRAIKSRQKKFDRLLTKAPQYESEWNYIKITKQESENNLLGDIKDHFSCDDEYDLYFELISKEFYDYNWSLLQADINIYYGQHCEYTFNQSESDMNTFYGQCCFWYFILDRLHITNQLMNRQYLNKFERETIDKHNYFQIVESLKINTEHLFYILNEIEIIASSEFNNNYSHSKQLVMNRHQLISILDKNNSENLGIEICKVIAAFTMFPDNDIVSFSIMYHYQRNFNFRNTRQFVKSYENKCKLDAVYCNNEHQIIDHHRNYNCILKIIDDRDMTKKYDSIRKVYRNLKQNEGTDIYDDMLKIVWHKFKNYFIYKTQNKQNINPYVILMILLFYSDNIDIISPKYDKYLKQIAPKTYDINECSICECHYGNAIYSKHEHENGRKHKQNVMRKQKMVMNDAQIWNHMYCRNESVKHSILLQNIFLNIRYAVNITADIKDVISVKCGGNDIVSTYNILQKCLIEKISVNSGDLQRFCTCIIKNYYFNHRFDRRFTEHVYFDNFFNFWKTIWNVILKIKCVEKETLQNVYKLTVNCCISYIKQLIEINNQKYKCKLFIDVNRLFNDLKQFDLKQFDLKVCNSAFVELKFMDLLGQILKYWKQTNYVIEPFQMVNELSEMYEKQNCFPINIEFTNRVIGHLHVFRCINWILLPSAMMDHQWTEQSNKRRER